MSNEEQDILVVSGVFPQITYNKKKIVNMLWRNQIAQQGDQNYYHQLWANEHHVSLNVISREHNIPYTTV